MSFCRLRLTVLPLALAALLLAPPASAGRDAGLAALQVALRARGLYGGSIDGVKGPGTTRAIIRFQRRAGLTADGVAGLQFLLAWHGFPSATIDGGLGMHTERAVRRFQRWAGIQPDGVAGATTFAALRRAPAECPLSLAWPVAAQVGDRFGARGNRFHAGIDLVASAGQPVAAAASGRVAYAGWLAGGWGNLVVVANGSGVRTMYAHLSSVAVRVGERVGTGARLGAVGATGDATGAHLHFEVRLRGAA